MNVISMAQLEANASMKKLKVADARRDTAGSFVTRVISVTLDFQIADVRFFIINKEKQKNE